MKLGATTDQFFRSVQESHSRFGGYSPPPSTSMTLPIVGTGLAMVGIGAIKKKKLDKETKKLVQQEVKKTLKRTQPTGLSFDLLGGL